METFVIPDEPTVAEVLTDAVNDNLDYALVIGYKNGGWYFSSSDPDAEKAVVAADHFKHYMMTGG